MAGREWKTDGELKASMCASDPQGSGEGGAVGRQNVHPEGIEDNSLVPTSLDKSVAVFLRWQLTTAALYINSALPLP